MFEDEGHFEVRYNQMSAAAQVPGRHHIHTFKKFPKYIISSKFQSMKDHVRLEFTILT